MAELNDIEIINISPKCIDTTPRNEFELKEGQSISTNLVSTTAIPHQDVFKDDVVRIKTVGNEKMSFIETCNSSRNDSDVEASSPKGKNLDIFLSEKVSTFYLNDRD